MSALAAARPAAGTRAFALAPRIIVSLAFGLAAAVHGALSFLHTTPAIYTDELLYTKLAQSVAAGEGLAIRGEAFVFPGVLPVLLQAPAWLLPDAEASYLAIKLVHALAMAAAAPLAYWAARPLASAKHASWVAVLVAASPSLLYHGYLMSEAIALPVFVGAVGVLLRAATRSSLAWQAAAVGAIGVACATRVQFASLAVAYVAAVVVTRGSRRQLPALAALALAGAGATAVLGPYAGAASLEYGAWDVARWSSLTTALVPFGVAWLLVPGALVGLAVAAFRPRLPAERAFAALAATVVGITIVQCGLVGAGQAFRPLERYAIYLAPLLALAFALWVERGAPHRRVHGVTAVLLGAAAWLVPLPSLAPSTGEYAFLFDSTSLSAYGALASRLGHADAATIFAGGAFAACAAAALAGRRRSFPAGALVAASCALLLTLGALAYDGDRRMTAAASATAGAPEPDWLEETGITRATYLALPGAPPHDGFMLETWNRNLRDAYAAGGERPDFPPYGALGFARDGTLLLDGTAAPAGAYVVNEYGSRLQVTGARSATPRASLALLDLAAGSRARGFAHGLFGDGWSMGELRYRVWGPAGGTFRTRLELPRGHLPRTVTIVAGGTTKSARVAPGRPVEIELPVQGLPPFRLVVDRTDHTGAGTARPRRIGVRVTALEYRAPGGVLVAQAVPRCCR